MRPKNSKLAEFLHCVSIIALSIISCKEETNTTCLPPTESINLPYENPIWHPNGNLIGFNHTPVKERITITAPNCPETRTFIFDLDSAGFWLVNADGTGKRRLLPHYLLAPAWSPDGNWIAYTNQGQIFKAPFNGTQIDVNAAVQLTSVGNNLFPTWSLDGTQIGFDSNNESTSGLYFVWTMNQDGTEKTRIAFTPTVGETRMPSWGLAKIVHLRFVDNPQPEVFLMDPTGANVVRLTMNGDPEWRPVYSPIEDKVAFISQSMTTGTKSLWFCNPANKQLSEFLINVSDFTWSPNGKLAYIKYDRNKIDSSYGTIWTIEADGTGDFQLTSNRFTERK